MSLYRKHEVGQYVCRVMPQGNPLPAGKIVGFDEVNGAHYCIKLPNGDYSTWHHADCTLITEDEFFTAEVIEA